MKHLFSLFTLVFLLANCSVEEIPESLIPDGADKYCRGYISELGAGNIDYCYQELDTKFQNEESYTFFKDLSEIINGKDVLNSRVISSRWQKMLNREGQTIFLEYEYQYNGVWIYYSFELNQIGEEFSVYTFKITPVEESLSELHEFTFFGKEWIHYLFLFFAILIPVFIIISVGFAFKTALKKKWLWIIYILFSLIVFNINWTTGELGFSLLSIKFLGAGFVKSGVIAPWILSFGIPFGAIHFWVKRGMLKAENKGGE